MIFRLPEGLKIQHPNVKKLFLRVCAGLMWYSNFDTALKSLTKRFHNVNEYNSKFYIQSHRLEYIWVRLPATNCLMLNLYMNSRRATGGGRDVGRKLVCPWAGQNKIFLWNFQFNSLNDCVTTKYCQLHQKQ